MKGIEIKPPEGYEIDEEKSTLKRIEFKPIVKELPKSWEALVEIQGSYVMEDSTIENCVEYTSNEKNKLIFPSEGEAKASVALAQLLQLRNRYNGDWEARYNKNINEKYCIMISCNVPGIFTFGETHAPLRFRTRRLAETFLENFKDLIIQAAPLL